jgi:hypothetical protein
MFPSLLSIPIYPLFSVALSRPNNAVVIDLVSSDEEAPPSAEIAQPYRRTAPRPPPVPAPGPGHLSPPGGRLKRERSDVGVICLDDDEEHDSNTMPKKRARVSIPGSTVKFEPFLFGEADTDEVTEVYKPCEAVAAAAPAPAATASQSQAGGDGSDDDEIIIMDAGNCVNAMAMPHAREDCNAKKFTRASPDYMLLMANYVSPEAANTPNRIFCPMCYCYVCEVKASLCRDWSRHCDATYKDPKWKTEKGYSSNKVFPLLDAATKLLFMTTFERFFFMPTRQNDVKVTVHILQSSKLLCDAAKSNDYMIVCLILVSVFQHGPGRFSTWGEVGPPMFIAANMISALKLLGAVICSPACDLGLLRVLAEDVQTATFPDRIPKAVLSFLFKFVYEFRCKEEELQKNPPLDDTAAGKEYLAVFHSCAAACKWERCDLSRPATGPPSVQKDVAMVLADILKSCSSSSSSSSVNGCDSGSGSAQMAKLSGAVWVYTSREHHINGIGDMLANLHSAEDVEYIFNVTQAALVAQTLSDYAIDLKAVSSPMALFVFFGILSEIKPQNSGHRMQMHFRVFSRLLSVVYGSDCSLSADNTLLRPHVSSVSVSTGDSLGQVPSDVQSFLQMRAETSVPCTQWMDIYKRVQARDSLAGGRAHVIRLAVQLLQYLLVMSEVYGYALHIPDVIEASSMVVFQRKVLSAGATLLSVSCPLQSRALFDIAQVLLTMKMSVLYEYDADSKVCRVRTGIADKLEYIRIIMQGFHEMAVRIIPARREFLSVFPLPILLSSAHIAVDEPMADVFSRRRYSCIDRPPTMQCAESSGVASESSGTNGLITNGTTTSGQSVNMSCDYCRGRDVLRNGNSNGNSNSNSDNETVTLMRLLDETDPLTFSGDSCRQLQDLLNFQQPVYALSQTNSSLQLAYGDLGAAGLTSFMPVKDYILTLAVRSVLSEYNGNVFSERPIDACLPDTSLLEKDPIVTNTPFVRSSHNLVLRRDAFECNLEYAKYLFVKIASVLRATRSSLPQSVYGMVRWVRKTSYYIDNLLGRCPWKSYEQSCDKSCWSIWNKWIVEHFEMYNIPTLCEIFLLDCQTKYLFRTLAVEQYLCKFFEGFKYVELTDLVPPYALKPASPLSTEQCQAFVVRLEAALSIIARVKKIDVNRYKSGIVTLCAQPDSFVLDLLVDCRKKALNERMYSLCLGVFAQCAVDNRCVTMMRLFSDADTNTWLRTRQLASDTQTDLLKAVIIRSSADWVGSRLLHDSIQRLLYGDMSTSRSQDSIGSPISGTGTGAGTGTKAIGTKSEINCLWPDLREPLQSFVFVGMADIDNVAKCEIILMLVFLGHSERIKKMFRSWYGMSRSTQRSDFISVSRSVSRSHRSDIAAASTNELFLQMILTAHGLQQRFSILCEFRHWIKWHFLCANAERYDAGCNHLLQAIDYLVELAEPSAVASGPSDEPFSPGAGEQQILTYYYELSFFGEPSYFKLKRYVHMLSRLAATSDTASTGAPVSVSNLRQCLAGRDEYYLLNQQDLSQLLPGPGATPGGDTVCEGAEFVNDDIAFTAMHHLMGGVDAHNTMTICISYLSARQLKLLMAGVTHESFVLYPDTFYAISKNLCGLLLWCSQWLAKPIVKMFYRWIMSTIFDLFVATHEQRNGPAPAAEDLVFLKHTYAKYEAIDSAGSIVTSRKDMFWDFDLTPAEIPEVGTGVGTGTGEGTGAGVGTGAGAGTGAYAGSRVIPPSLRDLAIDGVAERSTDLSKAALLRFIVSEPTVESFRHVDLSFLSATQTECVMAVLPEEIRMSSIATRRDYKTLWLIFISAGLHDKREGDEGGRVPWTYTLDKTKLSRRLAELTACMHSSWFAVRDPAEGQGQGQGQGGSSAAESDTAAVKSFLVDFCHNLVCNLFFVMSNNIDSTNLEFMCICESFFLKLETVVQVTPDMRSVLGTLLDLSCGVNHRTISAYLTASARPGCALYGTPVDFLCLFDHLRQFVRHGTREWRGQLFADLIGHDSLAPLAADVLYGGDRVGQAEAVKAGSVQGPQSDKLFTVFTTAIDIGSVSAALALEEFVVLALLEVHMSYITASTPGVLPSLFASRDFIALLQKMSTHFPYMREIASGLTRALAPPGEIVGAEMPFDFTMFFSSAAPTHTLPWKSHNGARIPDTYLADIGFRIGLICLKIAYMTGNGTTHGFLTSISILLACVAGNKAAMKILPQFMAVMPGFKEIVIRALYLGEFLPSQYSAIAQCKEIQKIVLNLTAQEMMDRVVLMRALWLSAIDSNDAAAKEFVVSCFHKAASSLILNTANAQRRDQMTNMLNMIRTDIFQSGRMESSWIGFYRDLCRDMTRKPVIKKLVIEKLSL